MIIILPKEVMMSYEDRKFENTALMVSASWHDILSSSYGEDYMTPLMFTSEHEYPFYKNQVEYFRLAGYEMEL